MTSNARGTNSSPGIYTREINITQPAARAIGMTALGLVGETLIGPAFQPIQISNYTEFLTYFGGTSPEKYQNKYPKYELPYIAKSYLRESQNLYVTRVLGISGYKHTNLFVLSILSGSTKHVVATLRSKAEYIDEVLIPRITSASVTGSTFGGVYYVTLKTTGTTTEYKFTLDSSRKDYISNVLSSTSKISTGTSDVFIEELFTSKLEQFILNGNLVSGATVNLNRIDEAKFNDFSSAYRYATTPWFVSELKGNSVLPLFRFITITDGDSANSMFKVSIKNIDTETMRFDVVVRGINDSDTNPDIKEYFSSCSLDPNDGSSYLGAMIGDIDEVYVQRSKYIMVEISDDEGVSESIPMGFQGYGLRNYGTGYTNPEVVYNKNYSDSGVEADKKYYFGLSNKNNAKVDSSFFSYKGTATGADIKLTKGFHLDYNVSISLPSSYEATTFITYNDFVSKDKNFRKFTAYFYGGFDGWDIYRKNRTNTDDFKIYKYAETNSALIGPDAADNFKILNTKDVRIPELPTASGMTSDYYAFWGGIRTFADPEITDINIFATPGLDWVNNGTLVNEAINMLENERKDAFYIITTPDKSVDSSDAKSNMFSATEIANNLSNKSIDTSYAATYYSWVQYNDTENGAYIYLPVTKDVVRNIAYTDNTSYAWFPPAGMSARGKVECVKAKRSWLTEEENILYDNRLNVVKTYSQDGVKIWGQKTLQVEDNPLNRIGVRRMMLYIRKLVRRSTLPLIFEPNDNTTKTKLTEIITPIFSSVRSNRGISDYYFDIDDSIEAKKRHEMPVRIWVKPIGALEYIPIDFILTDEGFDFNAV